MPDRTWSWTQASPTLEPYLHRENHNTRTRKEMWKPSGLNSSHLGVIQLVNRRGSFSWCLLFRMFPRHVPLHPVGWFDSLSNNCTQLLTVAATLLPHSPCWVIRGILLIFGQVLPNLFSFVGMLSNRAKDLVVVILAKARKQVSAREFSLV